MKGPDISKILFGGVLDFDSAGYYPGLELLNLVFSANTVEILSNHSDILYEKHSHDFARRLVWDYDDFKITDQCNEAFVDQNAIEVVRELLECLQLPIPNSSKIPSWERAHFFPYCRALIHWDARIRAGKVNTERRYLRGGGALAHKILREDKDLSRINKVRDCLENLFPKNQNTPLQKLSDVLLGHSNKSQANSDEIEETSRVHTDDQLDDIFRDGIQNILSHNELSCTARIKALINWTGFWLAIMQHRRALNYLGLGYRAFGIIVDCGSSPGQLRRASVRCLKDVLSTIGEAVDKCTEDNGEVKLVPRQKVKITSFFSATCAIIGLLNAFKGKRHFTLGVELLETFVLAGVEGKSEIPFDIFVFDTLFNKFNLVIGRPSAENSGLLSSFDASIFEDNEESLAFQMKAAGLVNDYSDATRMVSTKGLI